MNSIPIKSSLRRLGRSLLLTLLITVMTSFFLVRAFEGIIITKELERIESTYYAVGRVAPLEPANWFIDDVQELLEASRYVSFTDGIRVIQGVMDGVYSPDIGGYTPFNSKLFLYGTLVHKEHFPFGTIVEDVFEYTDLAEFFPIGRYIDIYILSFEIDNVALALPEHAQIGDVLRIAFVDYRKQSYRVYESAIIGQKYFFAAEFSRNLFEIDIFIFHHNLYHIDDPMRSGLGILHFPYISRASDFNRLDHVENHLVFHPLDANATIFLYPVDSIYQALPREISYRVTEEMDILYQNIHSIFLRPSKNLSINPMTAGLGRNTLHLLEGRFIDYNDHIEGNRVAVIRHEFAQLRGLSVGDSLNITMRESPSIGEFAITDAKRTFPIASIGERIAPQCPIRSARPFASSIYYDGHEYISLPRLTLRLLSGIEHQMLTMGYITDRETRFNRSRSDQVHNWREMETRQEEFEIVGIYWEDEVLEATETMLYNHVFVPDSVIPLHWDQDILYRNFSFVLESSRYKESFILEYQQILYERGFWFDFLENEWETFNQAVTPIRSGIFVSNIFFSILTIIVLVLAIFVYYFQSRKEYAIIRALGKNKRNAILETAVPILVMGFAGIVVGSIIAFLFIIREISEIFAEITDIMEVDIYGVEIPQLRLVAIVGLLFFFIFGLIVFASIRMSRYSVLELLQGNRAKANRNTFVKRVLKLLSFNTPTPVIIFAEDKTFDYLNKGFESVVIPSRSRQSSFEIASLLRLIKNKVLYHKVRNILALVISMGFMVVLSFLPVLIQQNIDQVEWLYAHTEVMGTILIDPMEEEAFRQLDEGVPLDLKNSLLELSSDTAQPILSDFFAVSTAEFALIPVNVSHHELMMIISDFPDTLTGLSTVLAFNNISRYEERFETHIEVKFLEGYDKEIFSHEKSDYRVFVASSTFLEFYDMALGDYMNFFHVSLRVREDRTIRVIQAGTQYEYRLVGIFEAEDVMHDVIVPLLDFQNHLQSWFMSVTHEPFEFVVDPILNRELEMVRNELNYILVNYTPVYTMILLDCVLRNAVEPLERNIALLRRLYPLIIALSVLVALGLTLIIYFQSVKEIAVTRTMGMSTIRAIVMCLIEGLGIIIFGLLAGMIISFFAFAYFNVNGAVIYLLGGFIAFIFFVIIIMRMKIMDLLQVAE